MHKGWLVGGLISVMMLGLGGTSIANALENSKRLPSFDDTAVVERGPLEGTKAVERVGLNMGREEVYMELGPGAVLAIQRKLPSGTISFAEDWAERNNH